MSTAKARDYAPKPPPAIAAQAARAEALQRQQGQPPAEPPTEPQAQDPAATPEPPAPETPLISQQPAPPPAPAPAPPAAPSIDWEARARAAEGRVQSLQRQQSEMSQRMENLEQLLATQAAAAPPATPTPAPVAKVLTPEEENDFGADLLAAAAKAAEDRLRPIITTLEAKLADAERKLGAVGFSMQKSAKDRFYDQLDAQVPDWKNEQNDPRFIEWMGQTDPYSGRLRKDLLAESVARHDAQRTVAFFSGFRSELTATDPQKAPAPAPGAPPRTGDDPGRLPLETFAAPGRATSGAPAAPPQKSVYTRAQIAQFYTDQAAGKFRGREAQVAAAEADLFLAQKEGRIIG